MNAVCRVIRPSGEREAIRLAVQRLWLTGLVCPVGAHPVVKHEFVSSEEQPLEVVYSLMLPKDAAMRRFRVEGEHFRVDSELRPRNEARQTCQIEEDPMSFEETIHLVPGSDTQQPPFLRYGELPRSDGFQSDCL